MWNKLKRVKVFRITAAQIITNRLHMNCSKRITQVILFVRKLKKL